MWGRFMNRPYFRETLFGLEFFHFQSGSRLKMAVRPCTTRPP